METADQTDDRFSKLKDRNPEMAQKEEERELGVLKSERTIRNI